MKRLDDPPPPEAPSNIGMGKDDVELQILQPRRRPFTEEEEEQEEEEGEEQKEDS